MLARLGPRFALEAGFLILVAVLTAVADLPWRLIVLVMGAALVLAAIHEYARRKERPGLLAPDGRGVHVSPVHAPVAPPPADELTHMTRPELPLPPARGRWPDLEEPSVTPGRRRSGGTPL